MNQEEEKLLINEAKISDESFVKLYDYYYSKHWDIVLEGHLI